MSTVGTKGKHEGKRRGEADTTGGVDPARRTGQAQMESLQVSTHAPATFAWLLETLPRFVHISMSQVPSSTPQAEANLLR